MQEKIMITLTNFGSGELWVVDDGGVSLRLSHDQANRLIMTARMHTVVDFIERLPALVTDEKLLEKILTTFEGKTSSERWNLKEKFARLGTLAKGYVPKNPVEIVEIVKLD
jgi:hypothetical protein